MQPHPLCPGHILPETVPDPEHGLSSIRKQSQLSEHAYGGALQDAAVEHFPMATSTHIASMIESLDDLLAGEISIPTIKEELHDENKFAVQSNSTLYSSDELDPAVVV
jgi:hypothetical protein